MKQNAFFAAPKMRFSQVCVESGVGCAFSSQDLVVLLLASNVRCVVLCAFGILVSNLLSQLLLMVATRVRFTPVLVVVSWLLYLFGAEARGRRSVASAALAAVVEH